MKNEILIELNAWRIVEWSASRIASEDMDVYQETSCYTELSMRVVLHVLWHDVLVILYL